MQQLASTTHLEKSIKNTFGKRIINQFTYKTQETVLLNQISKDLFSVILLKDNQVLYSRSFLSLKEAKQMYRNLRKCFGKNKQSKSLDEILNLVEEISA